jgi:hypothetical protein
VKKQRELISKTIKSVLGERQQKQERYYSAKESPDDMTLSIFARQKNTQAISFGGDQQKPNASLYRFTDDFTLCINMYLKQEKLASS